MHPVPCENSDAGTGSPMPRLITLLEKTDPAYDEIVRRLGARTFVPMHNTAITARLVVLKVEKIDNPVLQAKFYRRCAQLHDPAVEKVCTRFHGTPAVNVNKIARSGFVMPATAGLFGAALYSSNDAVKVCCSRLSLG